MPKKPTHTKIPVQPALPASPTSTKHNNQRLFSDHFLDSILPEEDAWQALQTEAEESRLAIKHIYEKFIPPANEQQTEYACIRPVFDVLKLPYEVQAKLKVPGSGIQWPDYVFYATEEQCRANHNNELDDTAAQYGAIAVGDAKQWDLPLDQMRRGASSDSFSNKNPSFQIFFYMLHSKLPWGILTNGRKWRLYHEATAYKLEVYYEVDLPELLASDDPGKFLYFYAFFRRAAFDPGHPLSLERMLAASTESSQKIRDNLRDQVYDALRHVAQGFFDYRKNRLSPAPEICQTIYKNSLILLYRLLFILYAESRDLLPVDENVPYRQRYSLKAIKEQVHKILKNADVLLPNSGIIWAQLQTLFLSIDEGNRQLGVNIFDGGLFDPEKETFLEDYTVGDLSIAQAIEKLAMSQDLKNPAKKNFIDYRDLSERHLGTIYEGLLEYTLHVADEPMVEIRSSGAIIPTREAPASKTAIARTYKAGDVYLVTDTGSRKRTGTYYTPDFIVKYMVEQALKPVLDEATRHKEHDVERIEAILAVNVLDPAMGSGHFPVEVVEYIARYLVELGVQPEGKDEQEADMTYWKRLVAQQCIYGIDMNPLAVELAKLSLWLATAAKNYPLNFLDHHLRPGNAVVGAWLEDVTGEHPKKKIARERREQLQLVGDAENDEQPTQFSMLEDEGFRQNLSSALDIMSAIEQLSGNTISEVKQQEAAYRKLRTHFINKYQNLLHLGTALFYDIDVEYQRWGAIAEYAARASDQPDSSPFAHQYQFLLQQAQDWGQAKRFFHWELEFPDIFFNADKTPRGEQAGFDVVIGNPPYIRQENLRDDKPFYQDHYEVYQGTADLFVYFFAQALRLLRPGGRLAYISSNSWLRANYATPLRRYLRTHTTVEQLIDLGNTRVFADAPDLSPSIQIIRTRFPSPSHQARAAIFSRGDRVEDLLSQSTDDRFFDISIDDQPDEGWQLRTDASRQLFARLQKLGKPLDSIVEGRMYRGILTGLNEAFIVNTATRNRLVQADPANTTLIKPLVLGEDLRPWYQEDEGRWLICLPSGWTEQTFPELRSLEALARERITRRYPGLATYLANPTIEETARKHVHPGDFWWEWNKDASPQTNLSPIFWLDDATRAQMIASDPACAALIQPFPDKQNESGTSTPWLLNIPYGWTLDTFPEIKAREAIAWEKFTARYTSLANYLEPFARAARKRQDKGQYWWELRPCDYYTAFEQPKIFYPDITKKPRFSWGEAGQYTTNTGYFISTQSYELLGLLNSRIYWFMLTHISQPLGERKGSLIYRLFTQTIKRLPIPKLTAAQRSTIASLAEQIGDKARQRYRIHRAMLQRVKSDLGAGQSKITDRLDEWWALSWQAFRDEVYASFKRDIPLKERGDWEALQQEERARIEQYTSEISQLEQELNRAVYAAFGLNDEEITIIEQETKYRYGEW